ncbi:hypothetical protein [Streptomyces sp. NPDC003077]|uniref:hypothetical protein n=1 Tax=Streptomyces sp. NPDC003077 TaxID=3154443 RepID=UPI0033A576BB
MSTSHTARTRRLAWGGLLLGALTGCGITPSGVIDAGEPAHGVRAPGKDEPVADVQLFFLGPDGLRPASRPAKAPFSPQEAIRLLIEGPNEAERQRGLSNALPEFPGRVALTVSDGRIQIAVPVAARQLSTPAVSQLVCTAANARVPGHQPAAEVLVTLSGGGSVVGPMTCAGNNAFPVIQPGPSAWPSAAANGSPQDAERGEATDEEPGTDTGMNTGMNTGTDTGSDPGTDAGSDGRGPGAPNTGTGAGSGK